MEEEKSISLGDIFRVLKKNIILIAIIVASAILIGGVYTFGIAKEKYRADTTIMVAVIRDNQSDSNNNVDYNSTMYMIESVKKLVKEDIVLKSVAEENEIGIEGLKRKIQILSEERTMLITIRVTDVDGKTAQKLANEVAESLITVTNTKEFKIFNDSLSVTTKADRFVYDSPNKMMYMMIFTLIGAVVACVVVFIKEFASTKYTSKKDVEASMEEKIIGTFFYDKRKEDKAAKSDRNKTVELVNPSIKGFEAYNKLLSNIKYFNIDNPIKVIGSVSNGPNELKSTVSANLAYCMANNGKKVVVVDLDLRKPVIYKTFGVEKDFGILEYIDGEITKDQLIKHSEYGVDIITSGKKVINPMAILESTKLTKLISELREEYDYVILDSAPLQACADSLMVAKLCDGVMFNVALKTSKKNDIKDSIDSLKEVGVSNIGINITKVPAEKDSGYYYYGE